MGERIEILSGVKIANPKTLLIGSLETGIVAFALCAEFVNGFEVFGFTVNGTGNNRVVLIENQTKIKNALFNGMNMKESEVLYSGNILFETVDFYMKNGIVYVMTKEV